MGLEKQDSAISLSEDVSLSSERLDQKEGPAEGRAAPPGPRGRSTSEGGELLRKDSGTDCAFPQLTRSLEDLPVFTHRHVECSLCR